MRKAKPLLKRTLVCLCTLCVLAGTASASPRLNLSAAVPLGTIKDTNSAVNAVSATATAMKEAGILNTANGAYSLALYTENALAKSAEEWVKGSRLEIKAETITEIRDRMQPELFKNQLENALTESFGAFPITVSFQMPEADITIVIDPDVINVTSVNTVLVRTAFYDLSFRPFDLKNDLSSPLTVQLQDISDTFDPLIKVDISNNDLAGYLTLSLPFASGNLNEMAIVEQNGEASPSFYNEVTQKIGGKIRRKGVYELIDNGKRYNDLTDNDYASSIMKMSSIGVVDGYSDGGFHPNDSVNRAQFVKIIMNTLRKINNALKAPYPDVPESAYYYHHAATAEWLGYVKGYGDGLFHGERALTKAQICTIIGRVLAAEKNYTVSDKERYLGQYDDMVNEYARDSVALLVKLGILDTSSRYFGGNDPVSRGYVMDLTARMLKWL